MLDLKSIFIRIFSYFIRKKVIRDSKNAIAHQQLIFKELINKAKNTRFGKDHYFGQIKTIEDFKTQVPIRDYEALKTYVESIIKGEENVLWPGKPRYFAKTSGTTSGVKYIPISNDSISNHINTARNALLNHIALTKNYSLFNGKIIFVSGSPELDQISSIATGRLSGIVNHEIPIWAQSNKLPSYTTNCIEDWPEKVTAITDETINEDMRLISGIPPWVQMYYESLIEASGKTTISEMFPNFSLFVYGGVNFKPYEASLEKLVGKKINSLETYPASEGFFAFQDQIKNEGLLLNTNSGIYYEFVPLQNIHDIKPQRLNLSEVEVNKDYAIIISNNAGLWAYNIGDTVRFVSLNPFRIIVSGRIKHHISAFGEHVIAKEVEEAISLAMAECGGALIEFTVAPQVNPPEGEIPYHEWLVEFAKEPENLERFTMIIESSMEAQNIYYKDLIDGEVLQTLKLRLLPKGSFQRYMESIGKLGGQNKVPRLANDRKIAEQLLKL